MSIPQLNFYEMGLRKQSFGLSKRCVYIKQAYVRSSFVACDKRSSTAYEFDRTKSEHVVSIGVTNLLNVTSVFFCFFFLTAWPVRVKRL